jgi:sugar phosphate isomerase/epimerase
MIGIGSPTFSQMPFGDALEQIADHFELWEVLVEGMHGLEDITDQLIHAKESLGMSFQVHAPMSDVNLGSVYEPMRLAALDDTARVLSWCRRQGIEVVTLHPGFVNGIAFLDRSMALERVKVSMKTVGALAEEHSVVVAVENMPANINSTCTDAAELAEAIQGTGLHICFDIGHANTSGCLDRMLEHIGDFRNVHLHNNDGSWDQHNTIDEGTVDIRRVVDALKGTYRGNLVIESTDLESGIRSKSILEGLLT